MIETECFAELNTFHDEDGNVMWNLRPDGINMDERRNGTSKPGFFSRLFRKKVSDTLKASFYFSLLPHKHPHTSQKLPVLHIHIFNVYLP